MNGANRFINSFIQKTCRVTTEMLRASAT